MRLSVRRLEPVDAEAAQQLGMEAFGVPQSAAEPSDYRSARHDLVRGLRGRPAGCPIDRSRVSLVLRRRALPTCGVAGVTVAAEHRGQGILTPLFDSLLRSAKHRGALISTLFPSAPRIYRKFGYEAIADYVTWKSRALYWQRSRVQQRCEPAAQPPPISDSIKGVYDSWARQQNGPLTRQGVSFVATAEDFIGSFTGVTVAVDAAGTICGFVSWNRGQGFGEGGSIKVADLLGTGADAYRALLSVIGSFASITALVKIDTSGDDLARLFLPSIQWKVIESYPYMLTILDVPEALNRRRYPSGMTATLRFAVEGNFLVENDGGYQLTGGRRPGQLRTC